MELREFALQHLPDFKAPTRIVFLNEIPNGPTGKPQRIGLADRLAQELAVAYEAPAEGLGTFEEHTVVKQREGLKRRVRSLAADGAVDSVG